MNSISRLQLTALSLSFFSSVLFSLCCSFVSRFLAGFQSLISVYARLSESFDRSATRHRLFGKFSFKFLREEYSFYVFGLQCVRDVNVAKEKKKNRDDLSSVFCLHRLQLSTWRTGRIVNLFFRRFLLISFVTLWHFAV